MSFRAVNLYPEAEKSGVADHPAWTFSFRDSPTYSDANVEDVDNFVRK